MLFIDWIKQNGERGQLLLSEWTGQRVDGGVMDIHKVTHGSGIPLFWVCNKCGHTWKATVNNRTSTTGGCPMCYETNRSKIMSKARISAGRTLKDWCDENNELGQIVASEWTGKTEDGQNLSIDSVAAQSNKRVIWRCRKNPEHIWVTKIQKRTLLKSGCPYCTNQKVSPGENDLETWCIKNNKQHLIEQFVGELEDGNIIKMNAITRTTHKRVKWKHITEDGKLHEWIATVADRVAKDSGCPLCTGMNNLKPGVNDLQTWCTQNPDIGRLVKEQWTGLTESGDIVSMSGIAYSSHTKLAWLCSKCGEPYFADLLHKLRRKSFKCNNCNTNGTSFPEQVIYNCIKQIYPNTLNRYKFQGYEFDITIPELKTCIEYGSYYYHKDKMKRDGEKAELCRKHGVNFIYILDTDGYDINDIWESNKIYTKVGTDYNKIKQIVKFLFTELNISFKNIDYSKATSDAVRFLHSDE